MIGLHCSKIVLLLLVIRMSSVDSSWKVDRVHCPSPACCPTTCKLTRPTRHKQLFNMEISLDKPQDAIRCRITMFYRFKRYQQFLLDIELDVCDFLGTRSMVQPLANAIWPFVVNHTNMFHPCPLSGQLYFHNITMDNRALGGIHLPAGQYRFDSEFFNDKTKEKLMQTKAYMTMLSGANNGMG